MPETKRYLFDPIHRLALNRNKMAFISGPRQCGKTTLAKSFKQNQPSYYGNWDQIEFRRQWAKAPSSLVPPSEKGHKGILILDEIHKAKGWKGTLKGLYDTLKTPCDLIVTGSARMDVFRKGGDSLLGRYIGFRLHPFSLGELNSSEKIHPDQLFETLLETQSSPLAQELQKNLLTFGGFPEPFTAQSQEISNIWKRSRVEKIIREDLRDLSHLTELSKVEMLAALLPERAAKQLSQSSLREDLEVADTTVRRWMSYLKDLFYFFEIKPYAKKVKGSLKKEGKLFLWDWSEVTDEGSRFENMVACHLLKAVQYWTDIGIGTFDLFYLRNKSKQEVDFLITRNKKPWLSIEVKLKDDQFDPSIKAFAPFTEHTQHIQLVAAGAKKRALTDGKLQTVICNAEELLRLLP